MNANYWLGKKWRKSVEIGEWWWFIIIFIIIHWISLWFLNFHCPHHQNVIWSLLFFGQCFLNEFGASFFSFNWKSLILFHWFITQIENVEYKLLLLSQIFMTIINYISLIMMMVIISNLNLNNVQIIMWLEKFQINHFSIFELMQNANKKMNQFCWVREMGDYIDKIDSAWVYITENPEFEM